MNKGGNIQNIVLPLVILEEGFECLHLHGQFIGDLRTRAVPEFPRILRQDFFSCTTNIIADEGFRDVFHGRRIRHLATNRCDENRYLGPDLFITKLSLGTRDGHEERAECPDTPTLNFRILIFDQRLPDGDHIYRGMRTVQFLDHVEELGQCFVLEVFWLHVVQDVSLFLLLPAQ